MFPAPPERQTVRVYVATSVLAGCEDESFSTASRSSFERFRAGDTTFVQLAVSADDLDSATEAGSIRLWPTGTGALVRRLAKLADLAPPSPCPTSERHRSHGTGPAP